MNEQFREYTIRDLSEFGIGHLTGESCAISLRILYDLTLEGVGHIENALSIKLADNSPTNWNSYVGSVPAIKSIKMSHSQAYHVLICILASQFDVVLEFSPVKGSLDLVNSILMAGNSSGHDSYMELTETSSFIEDNYWLRYYVKPTQDQQAHTGLDNYHAFSGRT